ncbi:MAG: pyruvate, phosphate dikinase, partial [bacterium]|nr:pyruvate, phosphate dikinase [bacterium]
MTARKKAASSRRSARKKAASSQRSARKKTTARKRPVSRKVFFFGEGKADGRAEMKDLLGGKGANLAEMSRLGVPVPPGFTISTAVCAEYNRGRGRLPADVRKTSLAALSKLEKGMGQKFGDAAAPLLLSVRSGARASMPGMMDTVLNLGLNDATVQGLAAAADERFAYDTYRRFIQMYGDVVLEIPHDRFEDRLEARKDARGVDLDTELGAEDWRALVLDYLEIVQEHTGKPFPQDPHRQLWGAVDAVFRSWGNDRARRYRAIHDIPEEWGTAVNVQAMVFGNMGEACATGVAFTRDPST